MTVYLTGAEKGGVGKSTIAVNLAAALAMHRRDVVLLDADTSGDAVSWTALRSQQPSLPRVHHHQAFGLSVSDVVRDDATRYQDVVVDAGGRDSPELRSAMTVADVMIMPCQASQFDVWQLSKVANLVDQARAFNAGLRVWAVINRASTNWAVNEASEAAEEVKNYAQLQLASTVLHDRKAVRDCVRFGQSVFELDSSSARKAAAEFWNLFCEVEPNGIFSEAAAE